MRATQGKVLRTATYVMYKASDWTPFVGRHVKQIVMEIVRAGVVDSVCGCRLLSSLSSDAALITLDRTRSARRGCWTGPRWS